MKIFDVLAAQRIFKGIFNNLAKNLYLRNIPSLLLSSDKGGGVIAAEQRNERTPERACVEAHRRHAGVPRGGCTRTRGAPSSGSAKVCKQGKFSPNHESFVVCGDLLGVRASKKAGIFMFPWNYRRTRFHQAPSLVEFQTLPKNAKEWDKINANRRIGRMKPPGTESGNDKWGIGSSEITQSKCPNVAGSPQHFF